jgi:hypothetical protein
MTEKYHVRPAKAGEVETFIRQAVSEQPAGDWIPVGKTYEDWLRDVRQAAHDDNVFVLGTGTLLWFENGDVYAMGLIGHAYVGRMVDGQLCHYYDAAKDHADDFPSCIVKAYHDDLRETIRGSHGEAEMTEEAKKESDDF